MISKINQILKRSMSQQVSQKISKKILKILAKISDDWVRPLYVQFWIFHDSSRMLFKTNQIKGMVNNFQQFFHNLQFYTSLQLKKLIETENHRLYRKIGLEWKLGKWLKLVDISINQYDFQFQLLSHLKVPVTMENCHMLEYVIQINFIPKVPLTRPD